MLRQPSALKKKQFVVHRNKKNSHCIDITKIKDEKIQIFLLNIINVSACDIAGYALNTLNLWRIHPCRTRLVSAANHAQSNSRSVADFGDLCVFRYHLPERRLFAAFLVNKLI